MNTAQNSLIKLATIGMIGLSTLTARAAATATDKSDWWSFRPAFRHAIPQSAISNQQSTINNPIDAFIQARLQQEGLRPSPPAAPFTLIRRLTYDLTGLPPTPEEIDAFVAASLRDVPSAVERLVDRLLASPRYGERWARHWLDVVHFGETHGYDKDKLRPHAWPYRDYVIRSLNSDKPYARFVQEQLAGDILYPDEPDGIVALGFIAAGPWDFVGHVELPESKTDGLIARYNDRDDMVMTTFSAFQSLTVHCARCHDHKFDPISQHDYYRLQAIFAGVDRANRPYDPDPAVHRQRRRLTLELHALQARKIEVDQTLAKISSPQLQALDEQLAVLNDQLSSSDGEASKKSPSNGYHSAIDAGPGSTKWVQVDLGRSTVLDQLRLIPARPTDFPDTPGFGFPVRFKLEISDQPDFTNAIPFADWTAQDYPNPGDRPVVLDPRSRSTGPSSARYIRLTATRLWERTHDYVFALAELQAFALGTNVARGATITALDSIESGRWARRNLVDGHSSRARLSDIAPTSADLVRNRELEAGVQHLTAERARLWDSLIPAASKAEAAGLEKRLGEVRKALSSLPETQLVYAAASDFKPEGSFVPARAIRPVHLLQRGEVQRPRELVQPGTLACVPGPDAEFHLPPDHSEGARRAALARWLTDPRNQQTRRSLVNRVWQYHFGRGLVETANDFGHMGSPPSHPDLLDWLAFWFLQNGESIKKLHRLIVTSATYSQRSNGEMESWSNGPTIKERSPNTPIFHHSTTPFTTIDSENRLLWRMNRVRLDAESIRDAMLFVSGQLDFAMNGPGDRHFFYKDDHSPLYDYTRFDVDAKEGRRRSIYRHVVRSVADPFMDCLDAADPSLLVARRNTTLTALQALATLNNPFVLRQCEHWAARLEKLSPELPGQIDAAYRLALGRTPSPEERQRLVNHARRHGLANACRLLFNSSEFMFVD